MTKQAEKTFIEQLTNVEIKQSETTAALSITKALRTENRRLERVAISCENISDEKYKADNIEEANDLYIISISNRLRIELNKQAIESLEKQIIEQKYNY